MTRETALNALFESLFSAEELRVHLALGREGGDLEGALPEVGVPRATLIFAAVEALKRRGLIDRDFFNNLEAARPKRIGDIRTVRTKWLHSGRLDRGELWAEGRYQLDSACGQGGFGLVWKAVDTWTGAFVALKILLEQHSDDRRVRQRFFRGAAVLARLAHPAIVSVHSGVEQEGLRFFYVMDFIEGASLDALVGKRPRAELLEYTLQIGDALSHLHTFDLLHRDIKPNNILVTAKQQAKMIDFDLVTGDAFAQMTTAALGTANYAPPEASASDNKTPAYDVFSLARTVEYVIRGRERTVAEFTALDPIATLDTSKAVQAVLRAALRTDPAERTRSVSDFCSNLRAALSPPTPTLQIFPAATTLFAPPAALAEGTGVDSGGKLRLANTPETRELKAQLLAVLKTPATSLARVLNSGSQSFLSLLNARKDQLATWEETEDFGDEKSTAIKAVSTLTPGLCRADMPGSCELKVQFLALLNMPATSLARVLNASSQSFLSILNARKEQLAAREKTESLNDGKVISQSFLFLLNARKAQIAAWERTEFAVVLQSFGDGQRVPGEDLDDLATHHAAAVEVAPEGAMAPGIEAGARA
jgi:serine/threonine protein kinase